MNFLNKQYTQEGLKLALPVMLTQVGQVSVNLFDNIIVGKLLGAQALASVSLEMHYFFNFRIGFRVFFCNSAFGFGSQFSEETRCD
jgi:MATE family multidrug resistance protein